MIGWKIHENSKFVFRNNLKWAAQKLVFLFFFDRLTFYLQIWSQRWRYKCCQVCQLTFCSWWFATQTILTMMLWSGNLTLFFPLKRFLFFLKLIFIYIFTYLFFDRSLIQGAIATIKRAVKKKGANDIDVSIFFWQSLIHSRLAFMWYLLKTFFIRIFWH